MRRQGVVRPKKPVKQEDEEEEESFWVSLPRPREDPNSRSLKGGSETVPFSS